VKTSEIPKDKTAQEEQEKGREEKSRKEIVGVGGVRKIKFRGCSV